MSIGKHIIEEPPKPFTIAEGRISVHQLCAWTDNYIWVLYDNITHQITLIDGPCAQPFYEWFGHRAHESVDIWNTHHHPDHVGINRELLGDGRIPIRNIYGSSVRSNDIPGINRVLRDGDTISFGGETFEVWRTDGHVDGHICYVHPEVVFCGDTLFAGGCGYLFDGPPKAMFHSLSRLSKLDAATKVCCAHEYTVDNLRFAHFIHPSSLEIASRLESAVRLNDAGQTTLPSTIGLERLTNPFMLSHDENLKRRVSELIGKQVDTAIEVFAATRRLKDQKVHR